MLALLLQAEKDVSGHFQAGRVVGAVIGIAIVLIIVIAIVKKVRERK